MNPREEFETAYVECALWATQDENDAECEYLDGAYGFSDLSDEANREVRKTCADFLEANASDLEKTGASDHRNGVDFFLTRNGHGAGFWDRGYGEVGDRLSESAKAYGEHIPFIGDDGQLHFG